MTLVQWLVMAGIGAVGLVIDSKLDRITERRDSP
jgi:hypothetical protein